MSSRAGWASRRTPGWVRRRVTRRGVGGARAERDPGTASEGNAPAEVSAPPPDHAVSAPVRRPVEGEHPSRLPGTEPVGGPEELKSLADILADVRAKAAPWMPLILLVCFGVVPAWAWGVGLPPGSWHPWEDVAFALDGCPGFTVPGTDQLLTTAAWALLLGAVSAYAVRKRTLGRNLASAAFALAVGSAALAGSAWLAGDLLGTVQFPSSCPPLPTRRQLTVETDRVLYDKATLVILPAVLILMWHAVETRSPRKRGAGGLQRPGWRRVLVCVLLCVVPGVFVLILVAWLPGELDDRLHGNPELPFQDELRGLSLLALLALLPFSVLRKPGVVAAQVVISLSFAQWLFIDQLTRDQYRVLQPKVRSTDIEKVTALTDRQLENLSAASTYYQTVLTLMLIVWSLSVWTRFLVRDRGGGHPLRALLAGLGKRFEPQKS